MGGAHSRVEARSPCVGKQLTVLFHTQRRLSHYVSTACMMTARFKTKTAHSVITFVIAVAHQVSSFRTKERNPLAMNPRGWISFTGGYGDVGKILQELSKSCVL